MAWRFRKRIYIAPGVSINLSKNGVSTTIGTRGASLTMGKNGTFVNTGIPGTGMYSRQKISSNKKSSTSDSSMGVIRAVLITLLIVFTILSYASELYILGTIFLAGVIFYGLYAMNKRFPETPDTQSTQENAILEEKEQVQTALNKINRDTETIKYEILNAYNSCIDLQCQIDEAQTIVDELEKRNQDHQYDEVIADHKKKLEELRKKYDETHYNADSSLTDVSRETYKQLIAAFGKLSKCEKINTYKITDQVDLNSHLQTDSALVAWQSFDLIHTDSKVPCIDAYKPYTLYFYPSFIIKATSSVKFEVIPYTDIKIDYSKYLFQWLLHPANDCEVVETHFLYETKNGSPDMRYSSNPLTTHAYYGWLDIKKVDATYIISNPATAKIFSEALSAHIDAVKGKKKRAKKQSTKEIKGNDNPVIEQAEEMSNWKNPFIVNGKLTMPDATIEKFNRTINRIGYFMDKYCLQDDFMNLVKFNVPQFDEQYIPTMVGGDVLTCLERMGKSINLSSELGIPLSILALRLLFHKEVKHNYIYILDADSYNGVKGFIDLSKELRDSTTGIETFFVSTFLSRMNKERNEKYLDLLYDFANVVASLDGNVEPKEAEFLNHILELKKIDYTSDNEEETQKEDTEETKQETITPSEKQEAIKELDELIGLSSVKKDIQTLTNFIKIQQKRAEQGLKSSSVSYHCLFTGNPGTGKTTVARIVAGIYKELGVLKKGHLVETDRAGLVAEYVGQTAVKTNKIIDSALDGVLFIDEAYSLISGDSNDFGREAIATLLKRMEDDRDRLVVILAGYTKNMKQFINSNPGLHSRFNRYIEFPDYTAEELMEIFELNMQKYDYHFGEGTKEALQQYFADEVVHKDSNFGNGRFVRNTFEKVLERQANRLANESDLTAEQLSAIEIQDLSF